MILFLPLRLRPPPLRPFQSGFIFVMDYRKAQDVDLVVVVDIVAVTVIVVVIVVGGGSYGGGNGGGGGDLGGDSGTGVSYGW